MKIRLIAMYAISSLCLAISANAMEPEEPPNKQTSNFGRPEPVLRPGYNPPPHFVATPEGIMKVMIDYDNLDQMETIPLQNEELKLKRNIKAMQTEGHFLRNLYINNGTLKEALATQEHMLKEIQHELDKRMGG